MPAPWSKSAPKSDRRLEWKALKAKHAKTISSRTVEVGLGKALDTHQTNVTAILALHVTAINAEAFTAVLASSKAVKQLAVGLEPKVKNNDDYKAFLANLKADAAWWDKTAQDYKKASTQLDGQKASKLSELMTGLKEMQDHGVKVDALLKTAGKKKGNYTPHEYTLNYMAASAKARPLLAKLSLLTKSAIGNYKLIVAWVQANDEAIKDFRLQALYVKGLERWELPADVDIQKLRAETTAIADGEHRYNRAKSGVY